MFRLPRLVILEIISREGSSSMSEGFLEFIRMLNSISFKELKGNKPIGHILQKNIWLFSFKCLQFLMIRPLYLPWIHRWHIPHLTASSQLAVNFWHMPHVNVWRRSQDYFPKRISENSIVLSKFTRILFTKSEFRGCPKKLGPTQKRLAMIFRATGRCK